MENKFSDSMSKRTDEELIRIVSLDRNEYQSLGLEAAEKEIEKRNLNLTKIEQIKIDLLTKVEAQNHFNAMKVGSLTRFINLVIDTICIYILEVTLMYFYGYFSVIANLNGSIFLIFIILVIGYVSYYVFMETKYQKTIGKFITKTKVVTKDGLKPSLNEIIIRTLLRLIPIDYISFLLSPNGFHDRLSDTTLIKEKI